MLWFVLSTHLTQNRCLLNLWNCCLIFSFIICKHKHSHDRIKWVRKGNRYIWVNVGERGENKNGNMVLRCVISQMYLYMSIVYLCISIRVYAWSNKMSVKRKSIYPKCDRRKKAKIKRATWFCVVIFLRCVCIFVHSNPCYIAV